jgi:DNA-binding NtrC family response regulator
MRGPELAKRLRSTRPGLKVLLVSGYAEEIVESGRTDSLPFLAKPFSAESLLAAVDAAMGHGRPEAELIEAASDPTPDGPDPEATPDVLMKPGPRRKGVPR